MQAAKDTFLRTLADRLAVVNPARTVTLDGASRPAVMAVENETPVSANTFLETFLLSWEGAGQVTPGSPLTYLDCNLSYGSKGTDDMLRTDRGRIVTAMDCELLQLCEPRHAAALDYTQTPPAALGANIFWTLPVMEASAVVDGILLRTAKMRLFFFQGVA
jgi:hypothetical protein